MKTRVLLYFSLTLIIIYFFGCRSASEIENRTEGFNGGKLRICIRINQTDIPGEYKNDNHDYMMIMGERRAVKLLESYIIINSGDADGRGVWLSKIPDVMKQAKLICDDCNDDYCEAFIDYDAGALKEIIGK